MARSTMAGDDFGLGSLSRLIEAVTSWLRNQVDLIPPYNSYQGSDWSRHSTADGFFLDLDGAMVQVDEVTYSLVESGESIQVRYTRRLRAISLDRFPRDDSEPESDE